METFYIYAGIYHDDSDHAYPEYLQVLKDLPSKDFKGKYILEKNLPPGISLFRKRTLAKEAYKKSHKAPSKNPLPCDKIST